MQTLAFHFELDRLQAQALFDALQSDICTCYEIMLEQAVEGLTKRDPITGWAKSRVEYIERIKETVLKGCTNKSL